jgi:hypothetical protein
MPNRRKQNKSVSLFDKTEAQAEDLAKNHGYTNFSAVVEAGIRTIWNIEHLDEIQRGAEAAGIKAEKAVSV